MKLMHSLYAREMARSQRNLQFSIGRDSAWRRWGHYSACIGKHSRKNCRVQKKRHPSIMINLPLEEQPTKPNSSVRSVPFMVKNRVQLRNLRPKIRILTEQ